MEEFWINFGFSVLFTVIKNPAKRKGLESAFRKAYKLIGDAFPQFKNEE